LTTRRLAIVSAGALPLLTLLIAATVLWSTWRLPFRSGDFFDEVSNATLVAAGIVLTRPGLWEWPATSAASAEQSVHRFMAGAPVKRTLFLHVNFSYQTKPNDCACWVSSLWSPGGRAISSGPPPGANVGRLIFRLGFVRADNAEFVSLIEEGTRG
jgi:hypothetical protein